MNNHKQGNEIEGKRNNNGNRSVNYKLGKLVHGNQRRTSLAIRVYEPVDWRISIKSQNRSEMTSSNGEDKFDRR